MSTASKKSVLIVDDDKAGEVIATCLEKLGYYTIYYQNGSQAFEQIESGLKYRIAIIDYSLSDISGNEIVLLSKKMNPDSPVIVTSGYNKVNHNGDLFVQKPFEMGFLEEKSNCFWQDNIEDRKGRPCSSYFFQAVFVPAAMVCEEWHCERRFSNSFINSSDGGIACSSL